MSGFINIGSDDLVRLTNRLEKMHKSDLPVVVRHTLNRAAVEGRKKSLPKTYQKNFTVRNKSFLRSRSRFDLANGFDISRMQSRFGINDQSDRSTQGLAKQEKGGRVPSNFIAMPDARVSKSPQKVVRKKNRLSNIAFRNRIKEGNRRKMIKSAYAAGKGGHILYGDILFEIRGFKRLRNGNSFVKMIPLYNYQQNRKVAIKGTNFMREAGIMQTKELSSNFVDYAKKRIKSKKL